LDLNSFPWNGSYFPDVPITLTAKPNAGYRFLRWEGITTNSNKTTINVVPKANLQLTAIFESDGSHYDNIIINEISFNNNASPDPGDWIELYNKGKEDINISGWKLCDSDSTHQYIFAANTWIKANEYLVVSNEMVKMSEVFGAVKKIVGPFEFGFGAQTDKVSLLSQYKQLIDEVSYSNVLPWNPFDLKKTWSLELKNPSYDNNNPINWVTSVNYGTPGYRNTPTIPAAIEQPELESNHKVLSQNYPNPFNDEGTTIEFTMDKIGSYKLTILDMNGRVINTLNDGDNFSKSHTLFWDGTDSNGRSVVSGIYFYRLEYDGFSEMKRMIKI